MNTNPYQPPHTPAIAAKVLDPVAADWQRKCRALLQQRYERVSFMTRVRQGLLKQLFWAALVWMAIVGMWMTGYSTLAIFGVGLWLGRVLRDLQWYRLIAADWPFTREVLDWAKVEQLAGYGGDEPTS